MAAIEGIFVPNIVPYDAQGRIAEDELRRIIRWLVGKGVTGFYPNGSMGEFIRLSYEERKRVLKIVIEEAAGKPILAGAAEPNVDLVLEMCRYCADLGCRAVSITAAVDAGSKAVGKLGKLIAAHVIARPHSELAALLPK